MAEHAEPATLLPATPAARSERFIYTSPLSENEQRMLFYAQMPITPAEARELRYYLDVVDLPNGRLARVEAVASRIVGDRIAQR